MYDFFARVRLPFWFIILIATRISCSKRIAPQDGLVGEYLFNNDASDKSKFQNHGAVNGATPTKGHKGKANSAYHFNGRDHVLLFPMVTRIILSMIRISPSLFGFLLRIKLTSGVT